MALIAAQRAAVVVGTPASKRRGDIFTGFKDFNPEAKALTVLCVPYSLDCGVGDLPW